jgi:glycosyltransferase involved in cell wall biosynthesis
MRILALSSEFAPARGGIGTYALGMAEAAAALGADITMGAADYGVEPAKAQTFPFPVVRFAGGPHSMKDIPQKVAFTRQALEHGPYDIVHAMDWPFFLPLALFARRNTRRIYTIHGSDVMDMTAPYKRAVIRATRMFSGNVSIVANSIFTMSLFEKHFPAVAQKYISYQHLGVAPFWSGHSTRSDADRIALGLPTDKFIVTTVGRLTPRKGHLGVLDALKLLPDGIKSKIFHAIVGPPIDAGYTAEIDARIPGIDCEVKRFSNLSDAQLRQFYANSDVFCLVGKPVSDGMVEGFGLVFLEAAAQGLPSIAGDIGGVKEVVIDEDSGLVVPIEKPEAVAAAIVRLFGDRPLLQRLGENARTRAARFSWARCAAATYGL